MEIPKIPIVGTGKLANAILTAKVSFPSFEFIRWREEDHNFNEKATLVHAGLGRQECIIIFYITHIWISICGDFALEEMF